jgi:hypothetical protein
MMRVFQRVRRRADPGAGSTRHKTNTCTRSEIAMESQIRQAANQTDLVRAHQTVNPNSAVALERHYSVPELAKIWFLSENIVRRIFLEEPGVLKLAHEETRHKRRYTTLRIPERIAQRVHRPLQGLT